MNVDGELAEAPEVVGGDARVDGEQSAVGGDDLDAVAGVTEARGVGELAAKVEATQETEDLADGRTARPTDAAREGKVRLVVQQHPCPPAAGMGR